MTWLIKEIMFLLGLTAGVTVHEFAHAWSASLLGDDFPRRQGRVSLNPLRHMAPLGTLVILIGMPFGWGRPVLINLYNFRRPRVGYLLSSLAGPAANMLVVVLCIALMQWTRHPFGHSRLLMAIMNLGHFLLWGIAIVNIVLATLNLIPIPPLDGSKIWPLIIPGARASFGRKSSTISLIVLVILLSTNAFGPILSAAIRTVNHVLPESDRQIQDEWDVHALNALYNGDPAKAEALMTQALVRFPEVEPSFYIRASARLGLGKYSEALQDINRAIELNPLPEYMEFRDKLLKEHPELAASSADR